MSYRVTDILLEFTNVNLINKRLHDNYMTFLRNSYNFQLSKVLLT